MFGMLAYGWVIGSWLNCLRSALTGAAKLESIRAFAERVVAVLKSAEAQRNVQSVCQEFHVSRSTYYRWRARYGGMSVDELIQTRTLELENRRLRLRIWRARFNCRMLRMLLVQTADRPTQTKRRL
ncbi:MULTISPECIES: transposase [unclassified Burkholderia]|uniref:transposase n=1 Tax=Burkholderia sp. MSMB1552 TaxID=1636424 RepID=UPI0009E8D812